MYGSITHDSIVMLFMKGKKAKKKLEKIDTYLKKFTKFKDLNTINLAHKHVCFGVNKIIVFKV